MSDMALNLGLAAVAVVLFVLFAAIMCSSGLLNAAPPASTVDMVNPLDRELLMRENLADTVLAEGESEWQCIVCLHMNNPDVAACHLCGGSQEASTLTQTAVMSDTVIMGNTVLGATFMSNFGDSVYGGGAGGLGGAGDIPLLDASSASSSAMMSARQRALRYRRLNRMQLTQRQRGAQRRRLWQRVQLPNGAYIWVRTALPLLKKRDSLISRLRTNTRMRRDPRAAHLSETIAEQLHRKNAATLGFYSELDERGNMSWKQTTDAVALPPPTTLTDAISIPIIAEESSGHDDEGDDGHNGPNTHRGPSRRAPTTTRSSGEFLFVDDNEDLDLEGLMSLPFKQKKRWFLRKIASIAVPFTEGLYKVRVRRAHVLRDSVDVLTRELVDRQRKEHLNIHFTGEPALDAGGVLREWFGLVCVALFDAKLGVFTTTHGENASYWINPHSRKALGEHHLTYFKFAGRLFGRAILEGLVFDAHFALPLLKHLLGVPITFSDLEFLDEELYKSCLWMRENDGVDALCVTFSVQASSDDADVLDLKPGGRDIDVTDENKLEYLALVLKYKMLDSVAEQLGALLTGLYEIIPRHLLTVFDYQELDFFLCGLPTINVKDWQAHSRVRHFAGEADAAAREKEKKVVAWFWDVVSHRFNDEERARLLQFATGSSRVPVEGFKALTSASGYVHQFTLQLVPCGVPPLGLCPRAHTCFNRIDLPVYKSKGELETYLTLVIQMEITGFGFE